MKILRISLSNIASLAGEHTVDFTKAPLLHAGLFSITGPTGSGKSTLLDAVCLALYGETPRTAAVAGSGALPDAGQPIQHKDPRNLLRRGCANGFAEVAFIGLDGLAYTAKWTVRRARNNANGALQPVEMCLFKGNTSPGTPGEAAAGGTRTQVEKAIIAKVGLSFDQFRRAVLLAQGDFATFLKAKDEERAEILQALTGTERFETISKAVFLRHRQEETHRNQIRNQMEAGSPLAPEARAEADEALRKAQEAKAVLEEGIAVRVKQAAWFTTEGQYRSQLEEASVRVRQCEERVEEQKPRAKRLQWIRKASLEAGPIREQERQAEALLKAAFEGEAKLALERDSAALAVEAANQKLTGAQKELAEVQRRHAQLEAEIARAQGLDGELIPLAAALQKADADHARAAQALKGAENEWTQFESELKRQNQLQEKLQSRLAVVSPFEPFAGELAGWLERLQTERKAREKKERANGLLAAENEKLSQANGAIEAQASVLEKLTKQESEARSLLEAAQKRVPTSDPETLSAERRRTDALQTAFTALHAHLETRTDVVQQQQHCAENLSDLDAQLAVAKAKIEELSVRQIPSARTAALQARESLHLAEAASSEQAVVLRQALVAGRACPVCGATEHPKAAEEHSPATAALQALRNDAERKEKHQRDLEKAQAGEEARVQTFATQRQKLEGEAKAFQKRLETLAGYAPSEPEARVLLEIPEAQRASALERRQKEVAQLLSELAKREDSRNQAEKEVKAAQQKHQQKAEALQEAKDAHAAAIQQQSLAANNRQTAEANLANATAEHEEALGKLSQVLEALSNRGFQRDGRVGESGGMDYEQEPDAFQVWFEKGAKDWNAAAHDLEEANKAEGILLGKRSHLESSLEKARTELSNQQTAVEAARTVHASKKTERNGLLGGRSVVEVQTANTAAAKAATQAEKDAAGTLSEAVVKLKTKGGLLEEAESKVARQTTAKKAAADAVEQWLQVFGAREHYPLDRLELDGWLANDAGSLEAEEKQLEQTRSALSEARGGAQKIQRQLDLHLDSKPTEDDFETVETDRKRLLLDAQSAQDAVEACRAVVLRDDDLLARNSRLDGMLRDQEKILAPWEKLNDLIGSADGKKFRNMAQQWTLEILLKHANAQLVLLSGRYRLERLRDSLNLLVTDLEMDGRQRSVHSLSGGESFLVSLGLALGLASLTSSRLLIQSLFIDEGFGSLDTETLRIALNALSQLEAQGRKVGVISHVSEMVDAIPVQVRVVRGQRGASRVVV